MIPLFRSRAFCAATPRVNRSEHASFASGVRLNCQRPPNASARAGRLAVAPTPPFGERMEPYGAASIPYPARRDRMVPCGPAYRSHRYSADRGRPAPRSSHRTGVARPKIVRVDQPARACARHLTPRRLCGRGEGRRRSLRVGLRQLRRPYNHGDRQGCAWLVGLAVTDHRR